MKFFCTTFRFKAPNRVGAFVLIPLLLLFFPLFADEEIPPPPSNNNDAVTQTSNPISATSDGEKIELLTPNDQLAPIETKLMFSGTTTPENKALYYYFLSGGAVGNAGMYPGAKREFDLLLANINRAEHYSEKVKIIWDFENTTVKIPRDVAEEIEEYELLVLMKKLDYGRFVKLANKLDKIGFNVSKKPWAKKKPLLKSAISETLKRFN